jgi:hypothetical protein
MFYHQRYFFRSIAVLLALSTSSALVQPGYAASRPAAAKDPSDETTAADAPSTDTTVNLINRLVERGVLTPKDSDELLLMAEADAADARAQKALLQAAVARTKALMALAQFRRSSADAAPSLAVTAARPAPAAAEEDDDIVPDAAIVRKTKRTASAAKAAAAERARAAAQAEDDDATPAEEPAARPTKRVAPAAGTKAAERARLAAQDEAAGDEPPLRAAAAESAPSMASENSEASGQAADDVVRVTYIPEIVKSQLREEVKEDVMAEARAENWASPNAFPDWVSRFRLFGDFRFRLEGIRFPSGNDNTGAFPNFNAINTGAPFDTSGSVFSPQLNVDQDRNRVRLRARLGAGVDLGENFSVGLRLATGSDNSPVTANQSLGAAGSGQGGNFSKYAIWLDRAFLKYEVGGLPDQDFALSLGRFDNPFLSTSMIWADDLGFDGAVAQAKLGVSDDVTPFLVVGAFPVFNTDLNFASIQPAKFKSYDKWLYAAQLGVNWELGKSMSAKFGAAYYLFQNIEGQLSTPFTPLTASDAGDTDASRPTFAQSGNTYRPLRDIIPGPLNNNGTIDQFQYYGLASKFHELAFDGRLDFNQFEPFQISLAGEYVKNLGFDETAIAAVAVNNRGAATTALPNGPFIGSNTAWLVRLTVGDVLLQKRWDWNMNLGYRKVGSDSVVDGFADADFGGGGTNFKGFTFGGNLALSRAVSLGLRWFSATQVAGPVQKNDIIQFDFNGKF